MTESSGDVTEDRALVEGLEESKKLSKGITQKLAEMKVRISVSQHNILACESSLVDMFALTFCSSFQSFVATTTTLIHELVIGDSALGFRTQVATEKITSLSEEYRDVARRGSLLYFVITDLHKMNSLYVYSLNAFVAVFQVRYTAKRRPVVVRTKAYRTVGIFLNWQATEASFINLNTGGTREEIPLFLRESNVLSCTRIFRNELSSPVWNRLGQRGGSREKAGIVEQGRDGAQKKTRIASSILRVEPGTVLHPW